MSDQINIMNDFIKELYRLAEAKNEDDAVYGVISWFDDLFKAGKFQEADDTLNAIEIERLKEPSILISLLCGTLAARNKLRARDGIRVKIILELSKTHTVKDIIELVRGL